MKKITIEGIEYTIVKMSHIILEAPDHSLMLRDGWDYLKSIHGDYACDYLENYIYDNVDNFETVTE